MYPCLKVLPPPICVDVRSPGHGQRMHAVFVLENMGSVETVLSTRAGAYAIKAPVVATKAIAEIVQLPFALLPVDSTFLFSNTTCIAHAACIEMNRLLAAVGIVFVLDRRVWALVRDHAVTTIVNRERQPVIGFSRVATLRELGQINRVLDRVDMLRHRPRRAVAAQVSGCWAR